MKYKCYLQSPIGVICIEENGEAITALYFDREHEAQHVFVEPAGECEAQDISAGPGGSGAAECGKQDRENRADKESALLREARRQLIEYFQGKRKEFTLPLAPEGTEFQRKVWDALCTIPYGETRSYGQIAAQVGNPKACRAVGGANNKNSIMILIPCHRVIGADGSLTGFGGGLAAKKYLLELEKKCIV